MIIIFYLWLCISLIVIFFIYGVLITVIWYNVTCGQQNERILGDEDKEKITLEDTFHLFNYIDRHIVLVAHFMLVVYLFCPSTKL